MDFLLQHSCFGIKVVDQGGACRMDHAWYATGDVHAFEILHIGVVNVPPAAVRRLNFTRRRVE